MSDSNHAGLEIIDLVLAAPSRIEDHQRALMIYVFYRNALLRRRGDPGLTG